MQIRRKGMQATSELGMYVGILMKVRYLNSHVSYVIGGTFLIQNVLAY